MKKAFTLIELIFVIVILGILAAVAIPKLAATRDDAKIVTKAQEINMAITEVSSNFLAHGVVKAPQNMSQVLSQLLKQGKAQVTSVSPIAGSVGQLTLLTQNGASDEAAFVLDINQTTLAFTYASCSGIICKQLQSKISEGNFSVGGERVVY